jgi:hypothetical protein
MRPLLIPFLILINTSLIFSPPPCRAQWGPNGLNLCSAPDRPDYSKIAADGQGGAVIVWADFRHGTPDVTLASIYAQRVDSLGNELWTPGGVRISPSAYDQLYPEIIVDASGNAWIVFEENIPANWWEILLQKLDSDGDPAWGSVLQITDIPDQQTLPMICSDGAGGAIVAWNSGTTSQDIYCQRVNSGGSTLWTPGGIHFVEVAETQILEGLVSNGAGGFIAVWRDFRYTFHWDIFAQQIDASGNEVWEHNGVPICIYTGDQRYSKTVADGSGGAIIVWEDERDGNIDIYAQGITGAGARRWSIGSGGVGISTTFYDDEDPQVASDGEGGAIISWRVRSTESASIHARKLASSGDLLWGMSGVQPNLVDECIGPWMTGDGSGGVFILWLENRYGSASLQYGQRVDVDGFPMWGFGGVKVAGDYAYHYVDSVVRDSNGGIILCWSGDGILGSEDLYAQRLDGNGDWGYPRPYIRSVADLPYDQGGYVTVAWSASQHDAGGELAEYTVWRGTDGPTALVMLETCADFLDSPGDIILKRAEKAAPTSGEPGFSFESRRQLIKMDLAGSEQYWELIDSHPAYGQPAYARTVPTTVDSMAGTNGIHYFQIIAHSTEPGVFWTSNPDSGYSVDNIAPAVPTGFTVHYNTGGGNSLFWDQCPDEDFQYFCVYRSSDPGFDPNPADLVHTTTTPSWSDPDFDRWNVYYKITARDYAGNESAPASAGTVTAVTEPLIPQVYALYPNVPNPFNPVTMIRYDVPAGGGMVTLRIYDVSGRLVKTLADGSEGEGPKTVTWDGRNDRGQGMSSGVYFLRMTALGFEMTRKMILLQ